MPINKKEQEPVFYFVFAQSDGETLKKLQAEYTAIRKTLVSGSAANEFDDYYLTNFSLQDGKQLTSELPIFKKRLAIFHYAGHANQSEMELSSGLFHKNGLGNLLAGCNQLKLVFLNGCDSGGMVSTLFENGVKVVIASIKPINDNRAYEFSKAFYTNLNGGNTILEAFKGAVAAVDNTVNAKYVEEFRKLGGRDREKEKSQKFAWRLYKNELHKDEVPEILNWKIQNLEVRVSDSEQQLYEEIRKLNKEFKAQKAALEKVETSYQTNKAAYDAIKDLAIPEAAKAATKSVFENDERQRKEILKKIERIQQQIKVLNNDIQTSADSVFQKQLQEKAILLNFQNEYPKINKIAHQLNLYGFIIRGTKRCAHGLLYQRIKEKNLREKNLDNNISEVRIDFTKDRSINVQNIWETLWTRMGNSIGNPNMNYQKKVIESVLEFITSDEGEKRRFLIRFDFQLLDAQLLNSFNEVWTALKTATSTKDIPKLNAVYLFFMEKNRRLNANPYQSLSDLCPVEQDNEQDLAVQIRMFPAVERLTANYLEQWRAQHFPNEGWRNQKIYHPDIKFKDIIDNTDGVVGKALLEILDKLNEKDRFLDETSDYLYL